MHINNYEIANIQDFILKPGLKGKKNRMRMRFYELLGKQQDQVGKEQRLLLKEQNALDDQGKVRFVEGTQMPDVEDWDEYQKELEQLLNEEFLIEENEKNKDMLLVIKDMVLDYENDNELSGQDAVTHYRLCNLVEDIDYGEDKDKEDSK